MNSENSGRAPFQFGGTCPQIPDIDDITVEIADLPDFCKFDRAVSFISVSPTPPPEPDPPIDYKCPCPSSDSEYVAFNTSRDCCNWTLNLNYGAINTAINSCVPGFGVCKCEKRPGSSDYICQDYICRHLPLGGAKLSGGGGACPSYVLTYKPAVVSSPKCKVTFEGDCETKGLMWTYKPGKATEEKEDVEIKCEKLLCVDCQGTAKDCKTIVYSIKLESPGFVELYPPWIEDCYTGEDRPTCVENSFGSKAKWGDDFYVDCRICQEEEEIGFTIKCITNEELENSPESTGSYPEEAVCKDGKMLGDAKLNIKVVNCKNTPGWTDPSGGGGSGGGDGGGGGGS